MKRALWVLIPLSFMFGFVLAGEVMQSIGPRPDLLPPEERPLEPPDGVSVEAVNEDLETVIQRVSEQTGIRMALSPDVQREKLRITGYAHQASLASFMAKLALTYGLTWVRKEEGGYVLELYAPDEVTPTMRRLMRLGRIDNVEEAFGARDAVRLGRLLETQLTPPQKEQLASGGEPPNSVPGGLSLNSLPQETRQLAQEVYRKRRSAEVLKPMRDTAPDRILALRLELPR
jgi:hypothetical protein